MVCLLYAGILLSLLKIWFISPGSPDGSCIGSVMEPLRGNMLHVTFSPEHDKDT